MCIRDSCRTTVVCDTIDQVGICLRLLAASPEFQLLKTHDDKNRLRLDFDADRLSGGYRDVQLSARLCGQEALAIGVEGATTRYYN